MRVRVVDASALGALVFGEPKADEIAKSLTNVTMVAPSLLWYELASICLKKIKSHPAVSDQILKAFSLARHLAIRIMEVDHSEVVELARAMGMTTYDASYLWLVFHLRGELVTLDEKIRKAAARKPRPSF